MLLKHVDMCREEDDSINIMGLDNTTSYDSEEEEEDEDDPLSLNLSAEGMWLCIKQDYLFISTLQRVLQSDYTFRFRF